MTHEKDYSMPLFFCSIEPRYSQGVGAFEMFTEDISKVDHLRAIQRQYAFCIKKEIDINKIVYDQDDLDDQDDQEGIEWEFHERIYQQTDNGWLLLLNCQYDLYHIPDIPQTFTVGVGSLEVLDSYIPQWLPLDYVRDGFIPDVHIDEFKFVFD